MKKLLSLSFVTAGLLLLAGCACDEMCNLNDHDIKPATAALHRKNTRPSHDCPKPVEHKPKKVRKVKMKRPKKVKQYKPKKIRAKKMKKPKKMKRHAYVGDNHIDAELAEFAPWVDEVADATEHLA